MRRPLSDGGAGSSVESNLPESVDLKSTAESGSVPRAEQATGSVSLGVNPRKTHEKKIDEEPTTDEIDAGNHRDSRTGNDRNRPSEQGNPRVRQDSGQGQDPDRES